MAANDILFRIYVYVVCFISAAIGQESEYLERLTFQYSTRAACPLTIR